MDCFPGVTYSLETAMGVNGGKISDGGHEGPHGLSAGCSLLRVLETVMISRLQFGFLSRCASRTVRLILQPNEDGAAQTYWAHWTGRVAQNHILVFHHPLPFLLVFYILNLCHRFSSTACLNATLIWLCGLRSLTVRLTAMEHVCAQRDTL